MGFNFRAAALGDGDDDEDQLPGPDTDEPGEGAEGATEDPTGETTPSSCSYCGGTSFKDLTDNGRSLQATCAVCGGTMSNSGTQWTPELIGDPSNHPKPDPDPRSGGIGGAGAAAMDPLVRDPSRIGMHHFAGEQEDEQVRQAGLPLLHSTDSHEERVKKLTQHYEHLSYGGRDDAEDYLDGYHPLSVHHGDHGVPKFTAEIHHGAAVDVKAPIASHMSQHIARVPPYHVPTLDITNSRSDEGMDDNTLAYHHPGDNRIAVNSSLAVEPEHVSRGQHQDRDWFSESGDASTLGRTLTHEYGHLLDHQQFSSEAHGYEGGLRRGKMLKELSKHIPGASPFNSGYGHGANASYWLSKNREHVINHVGTYASHSDRELIAELYAEHHHSPSPSEAARVVGRHLEGRHDNGTAHAGKAGEPAGRVAAEGSDARGRGGDQEGQAALGRVASGVNVYRAKETGRSRMGAKDPWMHNPDTHKTDWDQVYNEGGIGGRRGELHRGVAVSLPEDVHDQVHDESLPVHERANLLLDHLNTRGGGNIGHFWSDAEGVSRRYAMGAIDDKHRQNYRFLSTPVVVHAHVPDRSAIETDPDKLYGQHSMSYHMEGNNEVPLRQGTPVHVKAISWHRPKNDNMVQMPEGMMEALRAGHDYYDDPSVDDHHWNRHDFAEPQQHTASRYVRNEDGWTYDTGTNGVIKATSPEGQEHHLYTDGVGIKQVRHPEHMPTPLYHGTRREIEGDQIEPGRPGNFAKRMKHTYATDDPNEARNYAGPDGHVYEVQPTDWYGHRSDAKGSAWASEGPLNIVRKVPHEESPGYDPSTGELRQPKQASWYDEDEHEHTADCSEYGCPHGEEEPRQDWDHILDGVHEIHRGLGAHLHPSIHRIVHDESKPVHERAHLLLREITKGDPETRHSRGPGVGTHWTTDQNVAEDFAERHNSAEIAIGKSRQQVMHEKNHAWGTDEYGDPKAQPGTAVVLHVRPDRGSIDEHPDPISHGSGDIYDYHSHGEREVPYHPGASAEVKGISWKKIHDDSSEDSNEYTRHDFAEPQFHQAAKQAATDGPDWCAHRRNEHCFYPGNQTNLLIPQDRGPCPWLTIWAQAACPISAPGPMAVMRAQAAKEDDQVYLRFGHWPKNERSQNNVTGFPEDGVSVYELDHEGEPVDPDADLSRGHEHHEHCEPHCDLHEENDDFGNDTREEMLGRVQRAERGRYRGEDRPADRAHLVKGEMVGFGHDSEPLLRNVRRVGDWIDHKHLFFPGAEPHRFAREPDDYDYEHPKELPQHAVKEGIAQTAPPVGHEHMHGWDDEKQEQHPEHQFSTIPVKHGGFAGYVHSSEMDDDLDDAHPEHDGFDEDLWDDTKPEPTQTEEEHFAEHDEYPESHEQRHQWAYEEALEKKQAEYEPTHDDPELHDFIRYHGTNKHLWQNHANVEHVDLKQPIYATQPKLVEKHLNRYLHNKFDMTDRGYRLQRPPDYDDDIHLGVPPKDYHGDEMPAFVKHEGRMHAIEGHHRVASELLRKSPRIRGRVFDADKHGFPPLGYDADDQEGEDHEDYPAWSEEHAPTQHHSALSAPETADTEDGEAFVRHFGSASEGSGPVYYHGYGRAGKRLMTGLEDWDNAGVFVTHDPKVAAEYGPKIDKIHMAPDTKVKQHEGVGQYVERMNQARDEGYDVAEFHRPHDFVGHVIMNPDKIVHREPFQDNSHLPRWRHDAQHEGSLSVPVTAELVKMARQDPDFGFMLTASWSDVRNKAKRIRAEGGVRISVASNDGVAGEVKGDHGVYENVITYVPGSQKIADWRCGCKWAAYSWGRSGPYRRFEGRQCSHSLAMRYEAQSRGMFGEKVMEDTARPKWLKQRTPVTVEYDRTEKKNLNRRAVPPGNMKRTFEGSKPVTAIAREMFDRDEEPADIMKLLMAFGLQHSAAREVLQEALSRTAADEEPVTLYRGLHFGEGQPHEIEELHKDPAAYLAKHSHFHKSAGIHWTDDENSAVNFALNRDPEGWAHDSTPWDDDEPEGHSHGVVLHAQVHPKHILDHGSEEGQNYAMMSAIFDHDHPEREVTVRDGAPVHITHVTGLSVDPDGYDQQTTVEHNQHHTAAAEERHCPRCGAEVPADADRCPVCNAPIEDDVPELHEASLHEAATSRRVPLTDLITDHSAMQEVLGSYRASESSGEPVFLAPRPDMPGKYEIADGHHRVAEAIRRGETHVDAEISDYPDDEPYEGPFYDFSQHHKATLHEAMEGRRCPHCGGYIGPLAEERHKCPHCGAPIGKVGSLEDHNTMDTRRHAPEFGKGVPDWGLPVQWCPQCSGSGCGHCGAVGQVLPASDASPSTTVDPVSDQNSDMGPLMSGGITQVSALGPNAVEYRESRTWKGNPNVTAHLPNGERIGELGWHPEKKHITWVAVYDDEHRRKGVASGMLAKARQIDPEVHHNDLNDPEAFTDAGRAWAEKVGAKEKPKGPSVSGVALKAADTGRILMLQRGMEDGDPAAGRWEIPGGHHEDGDLTSLHAAIREFQEEVGQPFPEGGTVHHTWTSPNGVYQGHVVVIPSEKDLSMKDGRVVPNPDDPDGDNHEQAAWWDIDHARKNPALREEMKKGTPWKEIANAGNAKEAARTPIYGNLPDSHEYVQNHPENFAYHGDGYRLHHDPVTAFADTVVTAHVKTRNGRYKQVGYLSWFGGKAHSDGGNIDGGRISKVFVDPEHQHNGVATAMLDFGRTKRPDLRHSDALTDEGRAWAEKTASSWDALSYEDDQPGFPRSSPGHSNSENPGSTGFATSQDPASWNQTNTVPDHLVPSGSYEGSLHEEPEGALPSTDGADDEGGLGWIPPHVREVPDTHSEISDTDGSLTPNSFHGSVQDIVSQFQMTAGAAAIQSGGLKGESHSNGDIAAAAQAHLKTALKEFNFPEQQELINEGMRENARARNFHDLQIAGTHYEALSKALGIEDDDPEELFS